MTTAPIEAFCPSPTNPRTRFGGPEDEALAANVKQHGIIQPLVVRHWPGTEDRAWAEGYDFAPYEIVCGHRRYRAAKAAGLDEIPYILKELTDEQVATIQLIENLQREDLDALDEAEGYQRMIRDHGYSADRLADEIGKSRSYIYGRLKLTSLCPAGKAAMRAGRLEESIALLLARIPGAALQEQALEKLLSNPYTLQPMTHREASSHIRAHFTLDLGKAPFPTGDSTLVPSAGRCYSCPHKSGNAPLLFPDIENPQICTNPACFAEKKAANVKWQKAQAEAEGKKIIEGEAAEKLVQHHGGLKGHVNLDDKAYDLKTGGELRTYREILGDALDESQTVIIENPHKGEVIEALPNSVMAQALEKAGLKPAGSPQFDRQKEEEKKAREETAWRRHLHNLVQTLRASTLASKAQLLVDELVMVTLAFWTAIGHDQRVVLAKLWHQPEEKMDNHERERAFADRIPGLSQPELLRLQLDLAMVFELTQHTYSTGKPLRLLAAAERAGIDVEAEKTAFKVGNEAKKAGKTAKSKENEAEKHEEPAEKTKKLGALPNKHGVYTCEPDEIIKWTFKNDSAEIKLLELENGKWLHAVKTEYSQGGHSSPLSLSRCVAENREEALQANKPALERLCRHLKGAALNSFKLWLSGLISPAEAISTPPEAAQAAEVVAPEPKAAQAGDENPGEREEESPATAGEGEVEKPAQAETRRFQVGDVVRIEKAEDGSDELDEHVGKHAVVIEATKKQIGRPWITVRVHGTEEEITVFFTEATWVGGATPAQPTEESIETNETPSPAQPPRFEKGALVRVKANAKGPGGHKLKCARQLGTVEYVAGVQAKVNFTVAKTCAVAWVLVDLDNLELLAPPPQAPAEAGAIETDEKPSLAHRPAQAARVAYRHPDNADLEWSGRGKTPKWVENWLAEGGTMADLAVSPTPPAKAGKQQQGQAVTTCAAETGYRCEKTVDMFQGGVA